MNKLFAFLAVMCLSLSSFAQSNITLELKDAPVRTTLEMMFKQAGIKNFVIENSVAGFVTMKLSDQPFENSLKIVMRNSYPELTYIKENDIWIVKARITTPQNGGINPTPDITFKQPKNNSFEVIHLNHIDPYDLMSVFGNILFVNQFQRFQGGMNGNNGFGGGRKF
jgi:hypothetical protein